MFLAIRWGIRALEVSFRACCRKWKAGAAAMSPKVRSESLTRRESKGLGIGGSIPEPLGATQGAYSPNGGRSNRK